MLGCLRKMGTEDVLGVRGWKQGAKYVILARIGAKLGEAMQYTCTRIGGGVTVTSCESSTV